MNKSMSKKIICFVVIGTMLTPTVAFAKDDISKDETVYVTMYEDGKVKSEIVSDWLHNEASIMEIKDKSSLNNIKNIKGKEAPEKNGDTLVWKTDKKDLFYQGDTTAQLPLNFKITYYLNDSEISPTALAGKSGKVKIIIEIENKEKHSVTVNGKARTIYTPMTVATIINLPSDIFTNIESNGAPVISVGNNKVVSFVSFPGLTESLGLEQDEYGINIPNTLEVTADADKFKLGPILITATPELPDMKEIKAADNLEDLRKGLNDMKDAVNKLQDGAIKLNEGLSTAQNGVNSVTNELSKSDDKLSLVTNNDNVTAERKLIDDSFMAMNMDTSLLSLIPKYVTPQNIAMAQKTAKDFKTAKILDLLNDPLIKSLPALNTTDNKKNAVKLVNDTDYLSKIDMTKLDPIMPLLNNSKKLKALMGDAASLATVDMTKLDPLKPLLSTNNATKLNDLMKNASSLAQLDMSKLDPLKPLLDTNTATKLNGLMGQASSLAQLDMTKLDPLKPLLNTTAATELNSLLANANGLQSVDVNGMSTFLNNQITGSDSFKAHSDALNQPQNLLALNQAIDIAYPSDKMPQINAQLKGLITGFSQLTTDTANSMQQSKKYLNGVMVPTLNKLDGIKTQLTNDAPLVAGVQSALTTDNINNVNGMLGQLTTMQAGLKTPETIQLISTIKSALTTDNLNNVSGMLGQLTIMQAGIKNPETTKLIATVKAALTSDNINNVNGMLGQLKTMQDGLKKPETAKLISEVQKALSDENVAYLKTILPKLQEMKTDLSNNAQNLQAVKALLVKANDPATDETIAKIKVLEEDYKTAKPLLTELESQITPELVSKIGTSPALVTQLTAMQKDLTTNKKILEIVQDSLSENNVDRANQLIAALPTLTKGVNDLAEGSKTLADGLKEFNTKAVMKLDSTAAPKLEEVKDLLSVKDELVKLSENYESFTGISEETKGTVKFVMRTDEIKVVEAKQNKKVTVKEDKKSFWQWIKDLF